MKKLKIDIFIQNFHYHKKCEFVARCRRSRRRTIAFKTYPTYFQRCLIIIQGLADADNIILVPIFVTKAMKKLKIDIFMRNFHYHQKYRFGAPCRRPRGPTIAFKIYSTYFQSCLIIIQGRADADNIILVPIFVTKAMKKLKIDIFMRNFHYHQKYRSSARCRRPRGPTITLKTYRIYFQNCLIIIQGRADADNTIYWRKNLVFESQLTLSKYFGFRHFGRTFWLQVTLKFFQRIIW